MKLSLAGIILIILFINAKVSGQNFWEQTAGPEGGWAQCLAVDKQGNIYSGFDAGRYGTPHKGNCLYKSVNGGISWESLFIPSNKDVESIVIDTSGTIFILVGGAGILRSTNGGTSWVNASGVLYLYEDARLAVCRNTCLALGCETGIYISTNHGNLWYLSPFTYPVHSLYVDNEDNIFAGVSYGTLFRSSDYGQSWIQMDNGLNSEVNVLLQLDDSTYYAGTDAGLYQSSDSCNSWNFLDGSPEYVTSLFNGTNNEIFAGTSTDGFYVSTDRGVTWYQRNNGLLNRNVTCLISLADNSVVAGTYGDGLFISSTQGQSWQYCNSGIKCVHITSFLKHNQYLFAGSEEGIIYRTSDNGDTWIRIDSIYTSLPIKAFLESGLNSLFFSTSGSDSKNDSLQSVKNGCSSHRFNARVFKSVDDGNTWFEVAQLYAGSFAAFKDSSSGIEYLLAAADFMGVMLSTDDGNNWYPANSGIDGILLDVATNSLGYFFAASGNNIFRSTDYGISWQTIYTAPSENEITINISRNDYLYAGFPSRKLLLSTDYGDNWIDKSQNLIINIITSIATDSINQVYAGSYAGISQSFDYGEHWTDISSGMIGGDIENLICDNSGNLFVGPYGGSVYRAVNSTFVPPPVDPEYPPSGAANISITPELKWYPSVSADLYRVQVSLHMTFDSVDVVYDLITPDTTCIVDTLEFNKRYYWRVRCSNQYGWSLWSNNRWFKTVNPSAVEDDSKEIMYYDLSQNYPNPFNPETKIVWQTPDACLQTLRIYNILGQEVATLINEYRPAGRYEIRFNVGSLPSGVYIYKLTAGSYSAVRKMVILK